MADIATSLSADERRSYPRIPVSLSGRYMLSDEREYDCEIRDISASGITIIAPAAGEPCERVVVYVAEIGRLEGIIVRTFEDGFALELRLTPFKQEKLLRSLEWLQKKGEKGLASQRRHERIVPEKPGSSFTLPDGRTYPCEVIDMSISGASIRVSVVPGIGTPVHLGKMRGIVARHHAEGVAIEFTDMPDMGTLADHFGG